MSKFDVLKRFTGEVLFTAELDCDDDTPSSIRLGLAVKWGVKNRANLNGANLDGASLYRANLNGANLDGANLNGANLDGANLNGANLDGANLNGANLDGANLNGASLYRANLDGASLYRANLNGASLYRANLDGASLYRANLNGANLNGASLYRASLYRASGINEYIKCIQIDQYPITYTSEVMQIGCQRHLIAEWRGFDDERIAGMDGKKALRFWRKYKDWIFQTIDLCPATPTKKNEADAA